MRQSRTPRLGDLIIKTEGGQKYFGLVENIILDDWGHQRNVHVMWCDGIPPKYNEQHGYGGVNIHNCRDVFEVIRNGLSIR